MNPMLSSFIGAIVRYALMGLAGYAVQHGLFTETDATKYAEAAAVAAPVLAWSLYQKYKGRQKLVTALAAPAGMTENDLEAHIKRAKAIGESLPSVTTPKDEAPSA